MSQQTPGPWIIREIEIRGVKKFEIRAGVQTGYQRIAVADFEPDVGLIAMAPEMYRLLQETVEAVLEDGQITKDTDIIRDARAVLHKARGEE